MEVDTTKIRSLNLYMSGSLLKVSNRAREEWFIPMEVSTLESLRTKCRMGLETFSIQTKISTLDNLTKEKKMEKETIFLVRAQYSVGSGKMMKKFKVS